MNEQLYQVLKEIASQGKTDFYKPVARKIGIRTDMRQLFRYLAEVSEHEVRQGHPMLSVVVINPKTKLPGSGFFDLAQKLGVQKDHDNTDFFHRELQRVHSHWHGATATTDTHRSYWLEEYWPQEKRDLDNLFMWFHEKTLKKDADVAYGDRVLFYEVGRHPETEFIGAKTLFASGTVTNDRGYIPEPEQMRGGKRWIFKRKVKTDVSIPPTRGIALAEIKTLLNFEGMPQRGFQLSHSQFELLEERLRRCQEGFNETSSGKARKSTFQSEEKPYDPQEASRISPVSSIADPAERAARLEKSNNAHKTLLNKLAATLERKGYKTTVNAQVDLFARVGDKDWIFEVKSTHDGNFLSQVRHGIAQLYEYRYRYRRSMPQVELCLLLQTAPPDGFQWVSDYLRRDRVIHVCWPVPAGFYVGDDESLVFLGPSN